MTDSGYPPRYTVGAYIVDCDKLAELGPLPPITGGVFYAESEYPRKMPFLPIEQLPEEWKDGRRVFMKQDRDGEPYKYYYVVWYRYGGSHTLDCGLRTFDSLSGWFEYNGYNTLQSPTHFCPIPLE